MFSLIQSSHYPVNKVTPIRIQSSSKDLGAQTIGLFFFWGGGVPF